MEGSALVKVEGGQVEGGADSHARSRPENRAFVQAGGWTGHHGRVSESLAFLGLSLPAALTSATLIGGI